MSRKANAHTTSPQGNHEGLTDCMTTGARPLRGGRGLRTRPTRLCVNATGCLAQGDYDKMLVIRFGERTCLFSDGCFSPPRRPPLRVPRAITPWRGCPGGARAPSTVQIIKCQGGMAGCVLRVAKETKGDVGAREKEGRERGADFRAAREAPRRMGADAARSVEPFLAVDEFLADGPLPVADHLRRRTKGCVWRRNGERGRECPF